MKSTGVQDLVSVAAAERRLESIGHLGTDTLTSARSSEAPSLAHREVVSD